MSTSRLKTAEQPMPCSDCRESTSAVLRDCVDLKAVVSRKWHAPSSLLAPPAAAADPSASYMLPASTNMANVAT
jgi:hypothetical protein